MAELGREKDILPSCGEEPWKQIASAPLPQQDARSDGERFGVRDITVLDLEPLPTDTDGNVDPDVPIPPIPLRIYNQEFWTSVSCAPDGALVNTLWILVPAGQFEATTQSAANQAARDYYQAILANQLNCTNLICGALSGSPVYEILEFSQECQAGYWFSDPIEDAPDGITIFSP